MPFGEIAEFDRSELYALQFFHGMIDGEQGLPQRIAARVGQLRFIPGIGGMRSRRAGSTQPPQTRLGLLADLPHLVVGQAAGHLQPIDLGHARRILEDAVGQRAIAGEQDQAGSGVIEPPHGKDAAGKSAQDVAQRGPPLGIGHGGNHVAGFVQKVVARFGGPFGDAPGRFHAVVLGIGLGAKFGDHHAIHAHLSGADQFFRVAAGGDARAGDNFLQAFEHESPIKRFC